MKTWEGMTEVVRYLGIDPMKLFHGVKNAVLRVCSACVLYRNFVMRERVDSD